MEEDRKQKILALRALLKENAPIVYQHFASLKIISAAKKAKIASEVKNKQILLTTIQE